jgi:hypothetical protein
MVYAYGLMVWRITVLPMEKQIGAHLDNPTVIAQKNELLLISDLGTYHL